MEKIDWIRILNEESSNRDALIRNLDSAISTDGRIVKAVPFTTDIPVVEWPSRFSTSTRTLVIETQGDGVYRFCVRYHQREDHIINEDSGIFFIYEHPDFDQVYVLLTIEGSDFFTRQVLPIIRNHRPRILQTFISHQRLKTLITSFKSINDFREMTVVRASHRVRSVDQSQNRHQFSIQSWPGMEIVDAFTWVEENNWWFRSLTFEAKKTFASLKVSITRQGVVQTTALFARVFQYLILPICKVIHRNQIFFGSRSRLENPGFAIHPLLIVYPEARFHVDGEPQRFIEAMRFMSTASISVLQNAAYLQLSIVDYYDGSCIDLWVLGPDRIILVPQLRGTVSAIARVINHIFDYYAEGDICDFGGNEK